VNGPRVPDAAGKKERRSFALCVRDPAGRPVADAAVALLGVHPPERIDEPSRNEVLAQARTDAEGRCRLTALAADGAELRVYAHARESGPACAYLKPETKSRETEVRLPPEQTVSGRLLTLQGQPAAGVKVRVVQVTDKGDHFSAPELAANLGVQINNAGLTPNELQALIQGTLNGFDMYSRSRAGVAPSYYAGGQKLPFWPSPVTTDEQGRFQVRGLGPNQTVVLDVADERFAPQELVVETGDQKPAREVVFPMAPARLLEGRIVAGDTGQAVAGARVTAHVGTARRWLPTGRLEGKRTSVTVQTDAQGRYKVRPYHHDTGFLQLDVVPPDDAPYLPVYQRDAHWPRGVVRRQVDMTLRRGVRIQGKVTEKQSRPGGATCSPSLRIRAT
jgi:5-hydroxyisourate hydrolase-like protein (transthyretin family)